MEHRNYSERQPDGMGRDMDMHEGHRKTGPKDGNHTSYHDGMATDSWAKKEIKETGHALKSAAEHMEQAANWSGHKLEAGTSKAIKVAREVSGKLAEGAGYVPEEVGNGLKSMGEAISGFGKKILPGKR